MNTSRISKRRRLLWGTIYVAFLCVLVVTGFRLYLWLSFDVGFTDTSNKVSAADLFYPELNRRKVSSLPEDTSATRLLILGGSVAEQLIGHVENSLQEVSMRPLQVCNVGVSAHTTQDSLNKMHELTDSGAVFDVVIIYHGINDSRMNCVDPELFRNDYQHCSWYAAYARIRKTGRVNGLQRIGEAVSETIGLGEPESELLEFGAEVKTEAAFRQHFEEIIALAKATKAIPILITFASHFPEKYSRNDFEEGKLNYAEGQYQLPIEVWGLPENVKRAVDVHNSVVRDLVAEHELHLVDMASELDQASYFSDVCHLSPAGLKRFSEVLADHAETYQWLPDQ